MVGSNTLEPTDGHRFLARAAAATGRLTRAVADAAEDARKDVAFPVDHVSIGKVTLRDETNVLGHIRMGRAAPLAVDYLVEVVRIRGIRAIHARLFVSPARSGSVVVIKNKRFILQAHPRAKLVALRPGSRCTTQPEGC